ncbi:hypothetical protein A2U01_0071915, partial [Trifolium medium]|nr:hypothetical protein [Trifolium medium]
FGHFRIRARVASFDRFDRNVTEVKKVAGTKGDSGVEIKDSHNKPEKLNGGEKGAKMSMTEAMTGAATALDNAKGGLSSEDDVRVGDIVLKLGERHEPAFR